MRSPASSLVLGTSLCLALPVLAATEDRKRFSRPLCPYPQYARYAGSGDVNDAGSYDCVED